MKRCFWIVLNALFLLPFIMKAQTADEIMAKNAHARGGLDKLHAIKTLRMTARMSENEFRATYVQENKRDNKVREETLFQGMARVVAYDGHTAWQINPFGGRKDPELISAEESKTLINNADVEGPLVDYKQKGHTAELIGREPVEGTDCYKIKITLKDGDVRYYYLDADSFLEIKYESQVRVRGSIRYTETTLGETNRSTASIFPLPSSEAKPVPKSARLSPSIRST